MDQKQNVRQAIKYAGSCATSGLTIGVILGPDIGLRFLRDQPHSCSRRLLQDARLVRRVVQRVCTDSTETPVRSCQLAATTFAAKALTPQKKPSAHQDGSVSSGR